MNYLAHVFLSHQTPDAVVGAMLGDFVKGRTLDRWNPAVSRAIRLHRAIDRYTDGHPSTRSSRGLVSVARRRFAGILIDVFYDHFLARHWSRFHALPLTDFTGSVYAVLFARRAELPARMQRVLPRMAADDWLASYADVAAVNAALNGLARRFRYPARATALSDGVCELQDNYAQLEANFFEIIPQLRDFAIGESAAEADTYGRVGP